MRVLIALVTLLASTVAAQAVQTGRLVIEHDGIQREAVIDYDPSVADAPVLIALHGGLAGPMTVRRKARVSLAREGWVVVWPSAIDDWNDGRTTPEGEPYDSADDIGFLRKLIAELDARGFADPERVFFAGPSIGGIVSLTLTHSVLLPLSVYSAVPSGRTTRPHLFPLS